MHTHPTGPSTNNKLCPKNAPLTEFSNNTAHSLGWFGLWTFEDYYPMDGIYARFCGLGGYTQWFSGT